MQRPNSIHHSNLGVLISWVWGTRLFLHSIWVSIWWISPIQFHNSIKQIWWKELVSVASAKTQFDQCECWFGGTNCVHQIGLGQCIKCVDPILSTKSWSSDDKKNVTLKIEFIILGVSFAFQGCHIYYIYHIWNIICDWYISILQATEFLRTLSPLRQAPYFVTGWPIAKIIIKSENRLANWQNNNQKSWNPTVKRRRVAGSGKVSGPGCRDCGAPIPHTLTRIVRFRDHTKVIWQNIISSY